MEFRLLGEVQVFAAGRILDVGTPRQQAVLAALAVDAGRPVPIETLVDRVWGDEPPAEARNVLYSHLSRIRQLFKQATDLGDGTAVRLERRHAGYVLSIDPDLVDLHRFRRLADQGRDPSRTNAERASALAEALGLWRGAPATALPGEWVANVRESWHRRRLDAAVHWARAELRLGRAEVVIKTLPDLITEYPLAEPLECMLMEGLHAACRDAEAIDRYATVRERLAEALGADPGPDLRALYEAILRGELLPAPRPDQSVAAARSVAAPAQLPPDVYGFTGREAQLRQLNALLAMASPAPDAPGTVVIVAIDGMAGVGKTALAVHWAHQVAPHFADGQLYVNLRGFDPSRSPVTPDEAVRGFLDALDVPPERIPTTLDAQVGLYRSLLAGRRVLVLLDNTSDAEQVRPLLPGALGCMVVATSRNLLAGLVTTAGAYPMTLDLPTVGEARELLEHRLGAARVAAESSAVDEIVAMCARLPLALAIVATRAATQPSLALGVLAADLREAKGGLAEFTDPDLASDVRSVFSWSYRQLSPAAARVFRLLGLHPGPDIGTPAAASLAGQPVAEVRPLLAELARAHLLERTAGRCALHDLLRAYATELALTLDTDLQRAAALHRALSHYVHSAYVADRLLNPHRDDPVTPPPIPAGVIPEHAVDQGQALAWFVAEHRVLLAMIRQANDDTLSWQLPWTLNRFFAYHGHWTTRSTRSPPRWGPLGAWPTRSRRLSRTASWAAPTFNWAGTATRTSGCGMLKTCTTRPVTQPVRLIPTAIRPGCWSVRAATGRRLCTRSGPLTCSVPQATGPDRPERSTRSAGFTPCSATTRRPSRTASGLSNCNGNSATGSVRRRHGTASEKSTSGSADMRWPSPVTTLRSRCTRRSTTGTTQPTVPPHSVTRTTRQATSLPPGPRGGTPPTSSTCYATRTPTRSALSSRTPSGPAAGAKPAIAPMKENSPTRRSAMDSVSVNLDDIDALAQALDTGTLPATDLLRSLVTAIRRVSGDEQSITVSVEVVASMQDTFDAAFTPDPAPGEPNSGQQVRVTFAKIGR